MTTPRYVFETPRTVPTDRATLDRIADEAIEREAREELEAKHQRMMAEASAEIDHRLSEDDLDSYARTLEKVQALAGVVPFIPAPSEHF